MSESVTLRCAAVSDRGLVRAGNEDCVYAGPRLAAVADGVGGAAAGEVASGLAIAALAPLDAARPADALRALRSAVRVADRRIRAEVEADPAREGMGTTLTALLLADDWLALAHTGDSRAYLLRDGELTQVTRDDSYVQWLVDEGQISAEQAVGHPQRSYVTRVLQGEGSGATYARYEAVAGDRYLLCSDGLSDFVRDAPIARALRAEAEPGRCAARLVRLALDQGAPDNVSVVVADVVPAGSGAGRRPGLLGRLLGRGRR